MATPKKSPELNRRIIELRRSGLIIRDIKDKIFDELKESVSVGYICNICKDMDNVSEKIEEGLKELDKAIVQSKPYEVANGFYIFYKEGTPYPIAVEMVDNIFKDYSKHGANMTGQQVQIKYKLKPDTWNLLKSRLRLYKDSNIISPHTLERLTPDEQERYIEENIDESIQDRYRTIFQKKHKAKKESKFKEYSNYYYNQKLFLGELEKTLKLYDPRKLNKYELKNIPELDNTDTIDVGFSDLHLGKGGTDGIVTRIYKLTNILIQRPEKNINLMFLGDVAETFIEGGMHAGQIEHMDGIYGFDLMLLVVKTIENLLIDLYKAGKTISFYGVGGNHGRIAPHHDQDQQRTAELVIYEMIRRGVQNVDIDVITLREKISVLYLDTFNYILHHGDGGFAKKADKNSEKILWNNIKENKDKKSIIMYGDRHNINIGEGKDYTTIGLPALAGEGEYDKRLDLHSAPGFIIIKKNIDGDPDITIKRL